MSVLLKTELKQNMHACLFYFPYSKSELKLLSKEQLDHGIVMSFLMSFYVVDAVATGTK